MDSQREYWSKRYERIKDLEMNKAESLAEDLKGEYQKALTKVQDKINSFYIRYSKNNSISYATAVQNLTVKEQKAFRLTLKEYRKLAEQEYFSGGYTQMLENASIKARINRLECLYIETIKTIEELTKLEEKRLSELLGNVYQDAFYRDAYETQRMIGNFSKVGVSYEQINQVIHTPWASDEIDFSQRIWKRRNNLINALQRELTQSFIAQDGIDVVSNKIARRFDVTYNNARRLVETETAYACERANKDVLDDLGVEKYQILAVLDTRTSAVCQDMDLKVFDMKDYRIGVNAPPFHVYCRTTTMPYIDDMIKENDLLGGTRVARDKDNRTVHVEDDISYHEWRKRYIDRKPEENIVVNKDDFIHDKRKHAEIKIAERLVNTFGGRITIIDENAYKGESPDYLWDGKAWELKTIFSSNLRAIDDRSRKALHQVKKSSFDCGGIILDITNSKLNIEDCIKTVVYRVLRTAPKRSMVIIFDGDKYKAFSVL